MLQRAGNPIRQVVFAYYINTDNHGNLGDLKTVTLKDGSGNTLDTEYFRYWKTTGGSGYADGLEADFGPDSYARLVAAQGTNLDALSDAVANPFADKYFEYDPNSQYVTKAVVQGDGSSTSTTPGQGAYSYSYTFSGFATDYNQWDTKVVELLPDNNPGTLLSQNIVYTNGYGEPMLEVYQYQPSGQALQQWETYYHYDAAGRVDRTVNQSAITPGTVTVGSVTYQGYNDTFADLMDQNSVGDDYWLSTTAGLVEITDYDTSVSPHYIAANKVHQGWIYPAETNAITLHTTQYTSHQADATYGGGTIYPVSSTTAYRNTDGTGAEQTSYAYTWYNLNSRATNALQSETTTLPLVSAGQNGPGTSATQVSNFDPFGRTTSTTDADGYVNNYTFDGATGAMTQQAIDVNGLNLVTNYVVDALGRTTKETDPSDANTPANVTYTVYNDVAHEVLTYPGWQSATNTPTGPTEVTRDDRNSSPSYTETFTMTAPPTVLNGQPTGQETIGRIQSMERTFTSPGGQVIETDDYYGLGSTSYATTPTIPGASDYVTLYGYDARGRQNRVQSPAAGQYNTSTIQRTVYDGLGRTVSEWVGTNDTPASGPWSPTNNTAPSNMVETVSNVYDNGGSGDGNLTQVTQYPNDGSANRVKQFYSDWRDRQVIEKDGVLPQLSQENDGTRRPILVSQLDNLGEVTSSQRYDGDGVDIVVNGGVPAVDPAYANRLRAQTDTLYDDQQRVYRTNEYSVDQTNGTLSANTLNTDTWYNKRGQVIKTAEPGGLVSKTTYDGAGRPIVQYTTDGYNDSTWSDAGSVANNYVLSQTETLYDANGQPLLTTTRDRFHNETATGALGNPTTAPKARVSYVANYYDAAERLTNTVNLGTNGGSAYTWTSTVPARSDTVLVTTNGYLADEIQLVTVTGASGGSFRLTFTDNSGNAQQTSAINYPAAASDVQSALAALSNIQPNNVLVSGPAGGPWLVRFVGALGGTNLPQMTANGSALTGASPAITVSTPSEGGDSSRVQQVTDPRGLVTKTDYDLKGRTVRTIDNYVGFVPTATTDRTTQYAYDGEDHVTQLQAVLPNNQVQITQYVYGVNTSVISSNDLLQKTEYPDQTTGQPSTSSANQEVDTYNALGHTTQLVDRNGNTHTYIFDVLGRTISDQVTSLGTGVDSHVQRLDTAYDTQGNAYLFTSYSSPAGGTANIVNQVQDAFNGLGQLTAEYQAHTTAVDTTASPVVQYAYTQMAGGVNNSRLVSMTYPNGRIVDYGYNAGTGSAGLDDRISRLSYLADDNGGNPQTLESYSYLGLGTVVQRTRPQLGISLTYLASGGPSDAGDQYTGLDRFGRVVDQAWEIGSTNTYTDRFQYGYDRDSNVLYKSNQVNVSFGELYHANGAGNGYDGFNQLVSFSRGTLNATNDSITGTPSRNQTWTLDALGNWTSVTSAASGSPTTQNATFNAQNEVATVNGQGGSTYDNGGDMTTDQNGQQYVYDAWNRLMAVKAPAGQGGAVLESYAYDALGRRLQEMTQGGQYIRDLYYNSAWQVLEERESLEAVVVVRSQLTWDPLTSDTLILRDRDPNGSGTFTERLYVQQDAIGNVTAVVDGKSGSPTFGQVQERCVEDPYGQTSFLDPTTWQVHGSGTNGTSSVNWIYLHQAGRYDPTSGLYNFRYRDFSPTLGRWMELDPMRYGAGDMNLYRDEGDALASNVDPSGLSMRKVYVFAFDGFGSRLHISDPLRQDHLIGQVVTAAIRAAGATPVYNYYGWVGAGAKFSIARTINELRGHEHGCYPIIILGYSWGAATATGIVKDVSMKKNYGFQLVFTIDPVPKDRTRLRVPIFWKNNYGAQNYAVEWRNWYQQSDTKTLKNPLLGIDGIRGKPVDGADNTLVSAGDFKNWHSFLKGQTQQFADSFFAQLGMNRSLPINKWADAVRPERGHTAIIAYPPMLVDLSVQTRIAVSGGNRLVPCL